MTSCAAFGKRLSNCSCFCIDSAQRGKASLQLACGFIDHRVPPQLSPSRPRPLYFRVWSWEQHLFPPLQGWAGHFDGAPFNQPRCRSCFPAHHPPRPPASIFPWQRAWGGDKFALTHQIPPASYLPWRASGGPHGPTCLPKFGAWGSRGTWRVTMAMAQPRGPEQIREDAAGDEFTDVIKSRAGRTSISCFLVWGVYCVPATRCRGCALEVSTGFPKVVARSRGAAGDCHGAPALGKGGEPRRARPREERVRLFAKAETQVFLLGQMDIAGRFLFLKEATGYRFYCKMVTCFKNEV